MHVYPVCGQVQQLSLLKERFFMKLVVSKILEVNPLDDAARDIVYLSGSAGKVLLHFRMDY